MPITEIIEKSLTFISLPLRFTMKLLLVALSLLVTTARSQDAEGVYKIGVGISDITGPPAGQVLNGYINYVVGSGLYTRQFARAFVVESKDTGASVVYVTCDMGMIDHSLVAQVVLRLQEKYGAERFSNKNVMISATHTHSGVSGFMTYFAFLIVESKGFNPGTFYSAVDGIYEAIEMAIEDSVDGRLLWGQGVLDNTNLNRRRNTAYAQNPEWERDLYETTVDKEFTILRMERVEDGVPFGVFTWFAVHPEDFNPSGKVPIVSSDNKGYAALLFDYEMNSNTTRPGKGKFVSGFGSQNLGDVYTDYDQCSSPKEWIDLPPYIDRAKCSGVRQFWKALEIFNDVDSLRPVVGPLRYTHTFVDIDTIKVPHFNETSGEVEEVGLCKPALGVAYIGELDPEGELWEIIRDIVKVPSEEMTQCQAPKGIVIAAGEMSVPWQWAPSIFAVQLFMVGNVSVVGLPGEFTTMSGRRVRRLLKSVTNDQEVILSGLCNNYINYVTTPEEYDFQAFEGGATIFGRNTVPVVSHILMDMGKALLDDEPSRIPDGPTPPSFLDLVRDDILQLVDPPLDFGTVVNDTNAEYDRAVDTQIKVIFVGGSPRNFPLRKGTFLVVERKDEEGDGSWKLWRTDADIDTAFVWGGMEVRQAEITWFINGDTEPGLYRIRHFGFYRLKAWEMSQTYTGSSREFRVL